MLQFKHNASRDNFRKLVKAEHNTKVGLVKIKKANFKTFCDSLTKYTDPSFIWKKLKVFKSRWNTSYTSNEYSEEVINNVNMAIDQLCPSWTPLQEPDFNNESGDPFLKRPFYMNELEIALDKCNINSSPGVDGIDYSILKRFPVELKRLLLILFNKIFEKKASPNEWRKYLVFFIPKSGTNKIRPISLASCLLKTVKRILNIRLSWWLEYHKKLPSLQFGFRRGKSCIDNLALLNAEILSAFDDDEVLVCLSVDIKGAYDSVLPDVLVDRLRKEGVPELFLFFVYQLVSFRTMTLSYRDR